MTLPRQFWSSATVNSKEAYRTGRIWNAVLWTLACAPVALYFAFLLRSERNIPAGDDYISVLPFLSDWLVQKDLGGKLGLLNAQYFSHRIAATRMTALADYMLFGQVSFIHLQRMGLLAWGAVFVLLLKSVRRESRTPFVAAVAALLLMNPVGYTNFQIGMQAVSNLGVIAVVLLALHAAASPRRSLQAAGVALVAAAPWVLANGLLAGGSAACVAFACGRRRLAGILLGASVIAAFVYFHGFRPEKQEFSAVHFLGNVSVAMGSPYALLRLGQELAAPVGFALIMALGFFVLSPDSWRRLPVLCGFSVFLVSAVAMLAYGRVGWGMDYVLGQDRYKAYGLLSSAVLFLFLASSRLERAFPLCLRIGSVGASAVFCLLGYYNGLSGCRNSIAREEASALNRQLGTWFINGSSGDWPGAIHELQRAEAAGVYRLPSFLSAPEVELIKTGSNGATSDAANSMRVEARRNRPWTGYDLVVERRIKGDVFPRFALLLARNTPVLLPGMHSRMPLGTAVRSLSFIDGRNMSYFLPDALGVSTPKILIRCPPIGSLGGP